MVVSFIFGSSLILCGRNYFIINALTPGQRQLDGLDQLGRIRFDLRLESSQQLSVATDEKFLKIPFHLSGKGRIRPRQRHIKRMFLRADDMDFRHERERHIELVCAERFYFLGRAGFLPAKIVRGHADDDQPFVFVLFV